MTLLQSINLGILQGITEFLPVSSSLHLAVASHLMELPNQRYAFDLCLNFGSLLAILAFYHQDIRNMLMGCRDTLNGNFSRNSKFLCLLIVSSLPTIIIGGIVDVFLKINFCMEITPVTVIFFAVILLLCDRTAVHQKTISLWQGLGIGLAQSVALIPGVSRLGITISMMRYMGYSRKDSFYFSLLLSIPVVSGAIFLTMLKVFTGRIILEDGTLLGAGCLAAFLCGLLTIFLMTIFLKKHSFLGIIVYRIIFGLLMIVHYISR
ncbi:MAG: undecaprenyl-diphosphate phosphatase [Holosporaceae bacterium]|jgi:undecaprenyl-diphosphatase|nr:undecaprenyl-diphosphate phosphatase [Holosporaceae bacterium]